MDTPRPRRCKRRRGTSSSRPYSADRWIRLLARRHSQIQVDLIVGCPILKVLTETRFCKAKVGQRNGHVSWMICQMKRDRAGHICLQVRTGS
ncbi:conserved hypothetical protein [Cupriavidus necator]|uniref:Uncharacterized protein n=1 Tax=Cupriavidus necator TaxID=106590 RepID=A0A1K0IIG8_CUPNE|nr:conserved hypothetical protein [Cupriavidus necator]